MNELKVQSKEDVSCEPGGEPPPPPPAKSGADWSWRGEAGGREVLVVVGREVVEALPKDDGGILDLWEREQAFRRALIAATSGR